ncbi:transcriptional regulator [Paenibacillus frigoriresistens]|jgi:hypothetical protein|uniref:transcriptional regulator n=1 Tax=Paenibacillus alginolyticus TaxID=59839 RepID=UPI00156311BA|nr:transcriptional regulator [Paenibacillus frigoriresistens]NRF95772.1 transcriptional regulator [Paenibacillus frigoriresistens]
MVFKKRSKYGEFIDKYVGYGGQEKVREVSKLTPNTVTKACNDQEYKPTKSTMKLLIDAARFLTKMNINKDDFWM